MRKAHTAVFLLCLLVSSIWASGFQEGNGGGEAQSYFNKAADAILALKSARFSIKREGTPAVLDAKNHISFTAADCVYSAPDRVSCDIKVSAKKGNILQLTRVWVPDGTFQSNPLTKQFGNVPPDANFNGAVFFAKTGIPDILRTAVQNGQTAGHETIDGHETLKLRGEVSGAKLKPLMGATLRPAVMYPIELWIDERSADPARLHVTEPDDSGWLIDLFGINEPIKIPTPKLPPEPNRP